MKIAYFDCFSGISGDMCLAALLDVGADQENLLAQLCSLPIGEFNISTEKVARAGLSATRVEITTRAEAHHHRSLSRIVRAIEESGSLSERVKSQATTIFRRLAECEAKIHDVAVEEVHFHEVGAVDSIVDIVGSLVALENLGVSQVVSSPVNVGSGTVECRHGVLPVPAPATVRLLEGVPSYSSGIEAELTTPTGAALISALATEFGPLPQMRIKASGYGAGTSDLGRWPNLLRVILGERVEAQESDVVSIIETNIDDLNPQFFDTVMTKLFDAGALDVFLTPVQMKKSRPGTLLTVLCEPEHEESISRIIFNETSTFGLRTRREERRKLAREFINISMDGTDIAVKVGRLGAEVVSFAPEYEDCKTLATKKGVPVKSIYEKVRAEALKALNR